MGKYMGFGAILAACLTAGSSAVPPLPAEELVDFRATFPESDFTQLGFRKAAGIGLVWERDNHRIFVQPGTTHISQVDTGTLRCKFELPVGFQLSLRGVEGIFTHLQGVKVSGKEESIRLFDQGGRLITVTCGPSR